VLLVEWGDAVEDVLAEERLRVTLTNDDPEALDARTIVLDPEGPSWRAREEALATALAGWRAA
jgi:tRNA A37 threonylcarbamoyladenosine biosynthesis protein TsaE